MVGDTISINTSNATGHCVIASAWLHGTIAAETDKAIQVRADNGRTCWFPRKALKVETSRDKQTSWYSLARWFKPDGYARWFLEHHITHSFLAS